MSAIILNVGKMAKIWYNWPVASDGCCVQCQRPRGGITRREADRWSAETGHLSLLPGTPGSTPGPVHQQAAPAENVIAPLLRNLSRTLVCRWESAGAPGRPAIKYDDALALVKLVPAPLRERVRTAGGHTVNPDGELEVLVGQHRGKPVVRSAATKRLVKGSGRYPRANDAAATSKETAFKRTRSYREAMEQVIAPLRAENPKAAHSLDELVDLAIEAAEGSPQLIQCPHEDCRKKHAVAFKKEGQTAFKLIELMAGKAKETIEANVNVKEEKLEFLMSVRDVPVGVFAVSEEEAAERRKQLLDDGVIDADWLELGD